MQLILEVVMLILRLATYVIIIQAVMSWLVSFNVLSIQNPFVRQIWDTLGQITEPVYRPIRKLIPSTGGLDFTPMIVLIGIFVLQRAIVLYVAPAVLG